MTTFAITYDLHQPVQDYDDLHDTLESYDGWWHCLESIWLVVTEDSASEIRDSIQDVIDYNDDVLVFEASAPASWTLTSPDECHEWLQDNL